MNSPTNTRGSGTHSAGQAQRSTGVRQRRRQGRTGRAAARMPTAQHGGIASRAGQGMAWQHRAEHDAQWHALLAGRWQAMKSSALGRSRWMVAGPCRKAWQAAARRQMSTEWAKSTSMAARGAAVQPPLLTQNSSAWSSPLRAGSALACCHSWSQPGIRAWAARHLARALLP